MRTLGNIIWFVLVGLVSAILSFVLGLVFCVTIVGIPLGKQYFKLAGLSILPFGKVVDTNYDMHPSANIFWNVFGGMFIVALNAIIGAVLCVTIIGIPFGKQCFKIAKLAFAPFGAVVYK